LMIIDEIISNFWETKLLLYIDNYNATSVGSQNTYHGNDTGTHYLKVVRT
jgi:hypothetical protein